MRKSKAAPTPPLFGCAKHSPKLRNRIIAPFSSSSTPIRALRSREDESDGPYAAFLQALEQEVIRFGRPVALAHGDSHYFRVDKPLRQASTGQRLTRFTRIEPFGTPDIHWLRVIVDPADSHIFQVHAEIVEANLD